MKKQEFYYDDYYRIVTHQHDKKPLIFDENSDFKRIAMPLLKKISNQLFNVITGKKVDQFSKWNDKTINDSFINELNKTNAYQNARHDPEWTNAFDDAFQKFYNRLFLEDGNNNEKYTYQTDIQRWLAELLAEIITRDDRFKPLELIEKIVNQTYMLHDFYQPFISAIPLKWITDQSNDWTIINHNERFFKSAINTFQNDYFENYESEWVNQNHKEDYLSIKKAISQSEYGHLSRSYSLKNRVLFVKNRAKWMILWNNLKFPVLQDMALQSKSLDDLIDIAQKLIKKKPKIHSRKQLAFILLKNFFEKSHQVSQNLSFYMVEDNWPSITAHNRNEKILIAGKKEAKGWKVKQKNNYENLYKSLEPILGWEGIMEWLFSYRLRSGGSAHYMNIYNEEIEVATETYQETFKNNTNEILDKLSDKVDLVKITYIANNYENVIDESRAEGLLQSLSDFVKQKDFYWDMSFSPVSFPVLKAIGWVISKCSNPIVVANNLLQQFKTYYEGWNINRGHDAINRELFVCCGAILLVEHPDAFTSEHDKSDFINKILTYLIVQTRFAGYNDKSYKVAFILLNLVVNQVIISEKEHFEVELIEKLDNILDLLDILNSENYELSQSSQKLLEVRINEEVAFEKRKMVQRKQTYEIQQLEEKVKRFLHN